MEIGTIISDIANIIQYCIPGFLTLTVFARVANRDSNSKGDFYLVYCVIISYFLIEITLILPFMKSVSSAVSCIVASALGMIIATIFALSLKFEFIKKQYNRLTMNILERSTWDASLTFTKSKCPQVEIYTNDYIYKARLLLYGSSEDDPWIVIDACTINKLDKELVHDYKTSEERSTSERIILSKSEIKFMRVIYKAGDEHYLKCENEEEKGTTGSSPDK